MSSAPPELKYISTTVDNGIAILKYNRPEAGNALSNGVFKDLLASTEWALSNDEVRVVVQTGEGKFFTTGMDLEAAVTPAADKPTTVLPEDSIVILGKYHELLINTNKILIAAVNGPGIGYGTSSIALFDLVYAVPEAYFFTPFVKWGLCAEACSSVTFSRIMGRQKAAALLLADERLTAAELERAGLITKIIPARNFIPDVLRIAQRIARLPPRSLAFNKELMMKPLKQELLGANEAELAGLRLRAADSEPGNAMKAFVLDQERKRKEKTAKHSHL
ncbi:hypothetical protein LTR84_012671 [Exophiala bonariae]|uniref:Enoyl-CoA hydratase n=1 Tax=Exophiala bonariae TaxID=1690606 RepID=A0AAV9NEL7_9EURO|nr:hypothetical protein LTR84_012671 [Exophiala bonariae]